MMGRAAIWRALTALALLLLVVVAAGACSFAPSFGDGAFACAADGTCPSGYACAADRRCYRPGGGPASVDGGSIPDAPAGPLPLLLVADVSTTEGDDPAGKDLVFTARLVPRGDREVRVDFATVDGTAQAGSDYVTAKGTIVFPPGSTSQSVEVHLAGDRTVEPDEVLYLALSNPQGATIDPALKDGRAKATLLNDDLPGIIVEDVTVTEGDTGTTNAQVTVTLTAPFTDVVSVSYETKGDTAKAPADFVSAADTLTFEPGTTAQTVTVPIVGDTVHEPDEIFFVDLSNAAGAPLLASRAKVTIKDNDGVPTLSIADAAVDEGNTGVANMTFAVTLSRASSSVVTVGYASGGGTAGTSDYAATSGTLTFEPGETTQSITVPVFGDVLHEGDETLNLTLSAPMGATLAKAAGAGTIVDDDAPPVLSVEGVALPEGDTGMKSFPFVVRLSAVSGKPVSATYATSAGTASAGTDYVTKTGTVTIPAGQTTATIDVSVVGDVADEGVETFELTLSAPVNATLGTAVATGTILNDDSQSPRLSIDDVSIAEGNAGTKTLTFTVSLACPIPCPSGVAQSVSADYATADVSALAGSDYLGATGTVTFPANTVTRTIDVTIYGDAVYEPNETFAVNLSNAQGGAEIFDAQGIGTITNDDTPPSLSIGAVGAAEGNVGTKTFSFPVTLSGAAGSNVTVQYATSAGTATAGVDYQTTSGVLTFAPGEQAKTVDVTVVGDLTWEVDETFTVTLSNPSANATIAQATATGTITNDEALPKVSIDNASVVEGDSGTTSLVFTVTLSGPSSQAINVSYASGGGTATAGADYSTAMGTLAFAPGVTQQTISVTIAGDTMDEGNETFDVTLTLPGGTNATLEKAIGVGTIIDDDSNLPGISISDASAGEAGSMRFEVTVASQATGPVTVDWTLVHVTTKAADLAPSQVLSGTLTWSSTSSPGQRKQGLTILLSNDLLDEFDETFEIHLSNPSPNASIVRAVGSGTILDDDIPPTLSITDVTLAEGDSGVTSFVFTVTLSSASGRWVEVDYATQDDKATTSDNDYVAANGTLRFEEGETQKTITVDVLGDTVKEPPERFNVVLSNPRGATILDGLGVGTITNED